MSNSDIALRVENLGKRYRLGRETPRANSVVGKIKQAATAPFGWLASQMREPSENEILWALKDVNFEVSRGEVVGIIGHNGAGKSTLLKILSRITEPTKGFAEVHGRIAALLEVGTGMHPELTGRENMYMNGTVLGMKKREVDRKFNEIVAFSGIEKFLDTPVKRYSSGMRVRLGFAIAAHLEPEILVVDEVLAVGDANFQKQCLGKMEDVASAGRTVLFVSHRMEAVRALCSRAILLQNGCVFLDGECGEVVEKYYKTLREAEITIDSGVGDPALRRGSGCVRLTSIEPIHGNGKNSFSFEQGEDVAFELNYEVLNPVSNLYLMAGLRSAKTGELITTTKRHAISTVPLNAGSRGQASIKLPSPPLRPGEYPLYFGLANDRPKAYDVMDDLTSPLIITTKKSTDELGYDPTKSCGFFDVDSDVTIK